MALISEGRYRQFEHNVIQSLETIKNKLQETSANLDEIVDTVAEASEAAADAKSSATGSATAAAASATAASASQTAAEAAQEAAEAAAATAAEDAAATAIAAVEAAGESVLESIPDDYTELSDDVSSLKGAIDQIAGIPEETFSDIDSLEEHTGYINSSNNWNNLSNPNYKYKIIPIKEKPGSITLSVDANSGAALRYAFLTRYDTPVDGASANVISVSNIGIGNTSTLDIPNTAHAVYCCTVNNGSSVVFTALVDYPGATGEIDEIKSDIDGLQSTTTFAWTEYELISQSNQTGVKLLDTGYRTSDADYTIFAFPVVAGDAYKIVTPHMAQFQTQATVPSSGTLRRVGETYTAGTYIVIAPETATHLVISTPNSGTYSAYHLQQDFGERFSALQDEADQTGFVIRNQALPTNYKTYTADYGTASAEGRTFKVTGAAYGGVAPQGRYYDHFDVSANDKVYLYGECSVNSESCTQIRLSYCGNSIEQANPVKDTTYALSNVITCTNIANKNRIVGYSAYSSTSAANGVLSIENLILVNLTAIYGAGNEPDKAYMDSLVATAGWFQTLNLFTGKTVLDNVAALRTETDVLNSNVFVEFENGIKYADPSKRNDGSNYALKSSGVNVAINSFSRGENGDIIYTWGEFKVQSTESCNSMVVSKGGSDSTTIENPDNDTWYPMSARYDRRTDRTSVMFTGVWDTSANIRIYYKHVVSINLTQVFGQYNEPSRDLLDRYFYAVSQANAMDFEAVNAKMLNLGDSTRKLSHPCGSYVLLDDERNVKMGSMPDSNWSGWQEIGTYGQFNIANIPVYNKVHGTLETDGMLSVLPIWGCWSEAASSGNTHHGGHVFHGWTTDRMHRLTMVQNIYSDDEAAVFNYIPGDKSETSEGVFLPLRLGADNVYKGILIEPIYNPENLANYRMTRLTVYGRLNISKPQNYNSIPASASADGVKGDICVDENYIYVCTGTNTWKRVPLQAWT